MLNELIPVLGLYHAYLLCGYNPQIINEIIANTTMFKQS